MTEETKKIDFTGEEFEATQQLLNQSAKINTLIRDESKLIEQKKELAKQSMDDDQFGILQKNIDKYDSPEDIKRFLDVKMPIEDKLNRIKTSFFIDEETGEELKLVDNPNIKTPEDEFELRKGLVLYFKRSDYYLAKIDEEMTELNRVTGEINSKISDMLDPLRDNILAYAEHLITQSNVVDVNETPQDKTKRVAMYKKAIAIKNAYTLDNLNDIIDKHPGVVINAISDFKNAEKIKEIGKKYGKKLEKLKINFNLFSLLSDDIKDSLEYRCLPKGDYPEGLENFTVFFIIRYLSVGLPKMDDVIFHASIQICFNKLMDGSLDEDVAIKVKNNICKFLNRFADLI